MDRVKDDDEATENIVDTLFQVRAHSPGPYGDTLLRLAVRASLPVEQRGAIRAPREHKANINQRDESIYTASYSGNLQAVRVLLHWGADIDLTSESYPGPCNFPIYGEDQLWFGKETALLCASGRGHLDTVVHLLEQNADVATGRRRPHRPGRT
eukprot:Skav227039  [mRNA]  locus=scaffold72:361782:362243:+ [translate_table: standard]